MRAKCACARRRRRPQQQQCPPSRSRARHTRSSLSLPHTLAHEAGAIRLCLSRVTEELSCRATTAEEDEALLREGGLAPRKHTAVVFRLTKKNLLRMHAKVLRAMLVALEGEAEEAEQVMRGMAGGGGVMHGVPLPTFLSDRHARVAWVERVRGLRGMGAPVEAEGDGGGAVDPLPGPVSATE